MRQLIAGDKQREYTSVESKRSTEFLVTGANIEPARTVLANPGES